MCPKGAYIIRTSFSVHFLDSIPINNFRSSEIKRHAEYFLINEFFEVGVMSPNKDPSCVRDIVIA